MKISDKFPEIKFFIENPTSYENFVSSRWQDT